MTNDTDEMEFFSIDGVQFRADHRRGSSMAPFREGRDWYLQRWNQYHKAWEFVADMLADGEATYVRAQEVVRREAAWRLKQRGLEVQWARQREERAQQNEGDTE